LKVRKAFADMNGHNEIDIREGFFNTHSNCVRQLANLIDKNFNSYDNIYGKVGWKC
jgi:hypothetical protein